MNIRNIEPEQSVKKKPPFAVLKKKLKQTGSLAPLMAVTEK